MHQLKKLLPLLALAFLLNACGGGTGKQATGPKAGGGQAGYKVGNPYEVSGTWYYPKENYSYDETGIASWYGQDFHEKKTANGEIFNKDELTAAHPTLPMPSLARVTNLDNGKSIVVRINDRGPFAAGRLIDLSQRGAQLLGYEGQGTAKVRVQVLADESKAIADAMRHYGSNTQVASAEEAPPMQAAPRSSVETQQLEPPSNTVETAPKPTLTNAETHQQLLETKPLPEVVQLPVTGANHIYVQAGSFKVVENANRLGQKLGKVGNVKVTDAMVNGAKFYRVRVGPISDVAHADEILQQVVKAGVSKPRIIVD